MKIQATRIHQISCGHRVFEHENKCMHLHGHNYTFHITCEAEKLDKLGRVIDFSVIKDVLCAFLEKELDHRFLIFERDPLASTLLSLDEKVKIVPFNPTAENIASWLGNEIFPKLLSSLDVECSKIKLFETDKCYVVWQR